MQSPRAKCEPQKKPEESYVLVKDLSISSLEFFHKRNSGDIHRKTFVKEKLKKNIGTDVASPTIPYRLYFPSATPVAFIIRQLFK